MPGTQKPRERWGNPVQDLRLPLRRPSHPLSILLCGPDSDLYGPHLLRPYLLASPWAQPMRGTGQDLESGERSHGPYAPPSLPCGPRCAYPAGLVVQSLFQPHSGNHSLLCPLRPKGAKASPGTSSRSRSVFLADSLNSAHTTARGAWATTPLTVSCPDPDPGWQGEGTQGDPQGAQPGGPWGQDERAWALFLGREP